MAARSEYAAILRDARTSRELLRMRVEHVASTKLVSPENSLSNARMHDTPDQEHWHEPKAGENAGLGKFLRKPMPYDSFMEAEGVPVFRGIGVRRVQDLPMKPWARLGGRGSYIQLYGTEGLWGMYVVEIPGAGALNVERHLYEKVCLVVEGRGSTEVWQEGQGKKHVLDRKSVV